MIRKVLGFVAAAFVAVPVAQAVETSELLVYAESGRSIAIDLVNNADVTAFQAEIKVSGVMSSKVQTSGCTAMLPKSHQGACSFRDGTYRLVVFSPSNAVLPSGKIGSINLNAPISSVKSIKVDNLLMGNDKAEELPARALVDVGQLVFDAEDFNK